MIFDTVFKNNWLEIIENRILNLDKSDLRDLVKFEETFFSLMDGWIQLVIKNIKSNDGKELELACKKYAKIYKDDVGNRYNELQRQDNIIFELRKRVFDEGFSPWGGKLIRPLYVNLFAELRNKGIMDSAALPSTFVGLMFSVLNKRDQITQESMLEEFNKFTIAPYQKFEEKFDKMMALIRKYRHDI